MGSRTYLFLLGDVCYFVFFLCIWDLTYKITVETGEYYFEANILSKKIRKTSLLSMRVLPKMVIILGDSHWISYTFI